MERVAFYHCDQVGTLQTLSNELGECIWEIKQDTWGTTQEIKTANESNPLEQSNLRFQGQYYDKETGLHYNRYRYYEPYSARYVSKDPIGLNGGFHETTYIKNPNGWVDPMGLAGEAVLDKVFSGVKLLGNSPAGILVRGIFTVNGTTGTCDGPNPTLPPIECGHVGSIQGDKQLVPNAIFSGRKENIDEFAAESDHKRYKDYCNKPPKPTDDKCEDFRQQYKHMKECKRLRERWDDLYWPGRHASDITVLKDRMKKTKKRYDNAESCKGQPFE